MEFQVTDKAMPTSSKRTITEHGFLLVRDCALSIAGVTEYSASNFQPRMYNDRNPNDVIRVFRSVDTLAESVPLWYGSPMGNDHPADFFNTDNTRELQVGSVIGQPKMVGPILQADILVTDSRTIKEITDGFKEELSNGYYSAYDFTPGIAPNGEPFDCQQLKLRPNHVAVVAAGRCGSICKVSDSADVTPKEAPKMGTVTVNGVTYEATEQLIQVVNGLQSQLSELMAAAAAAPAQAEAAIADATSKVDEVTAQVADLTTQLADATSPETLDAAVEERQEVTDAARKLIANFDCKGKSNADIRKEIVKAKCPEVAIKNLDSADYVRARFEGLATTVQNTPRRGKLDTALADSLKVQDSADDDFPNVDAARKAAIARRSQAHLPAAKRKA